MGHSLSSLLEKPSKPGINHLCAGLAGSAGHGGAVPPRRVASWPGGRCFSAGATVHGSTRSAYSQCPGWRRLQDKKENEALYVSSFKLCIWQTMGWGEGRGGVQVEWKSRFCIHIGNSLKTEERFEVYNTERNNLCPHPRDGKPLNTNQLTFYPHLHFVL